MPDSGKILVVSNGRLLFEKIQSLLYEEKYKIKFTFSADPSLEQIIKQYEPKLIVVDPEAPEMSGVTLSMLIRRWSNAPILMLSPIDSGPDEVRILDVTTKGWLSEPLRIDLVGVRVKAITG